MSVSDGPQVVEVEGPAGSEPELELADASPEAVLELFEQRGWGDGLPLVPPTRERVERMLAAAGGEAAAGEVVATLPPRFGQATRRILAVNAVLAGCPEAVFPVLVSAVRALSRSELNLRGVNATTHPVAPLLIVHGDRDPTVPLEQSTTFHARLQAAGADSTLHVVAGAGHGGEEFRTPEMHERVAAFFDRHLARR